MARARSHRGSGRSSARACSWCSRTTWSCSAALIHSDLWFALAWGAFPVLTASFAQTARIEPEALALAAACAAISAAQRVLSTPVRRLRRRVATVEGTHHAAGRRRRADRRGHAPLGTGASAPVDVARDAAPRPRPAARRGSRASRRPSSSSRPLRRTDRSRRRTNATHAIANSVSSSNSVETDATWGLSALRTALNTYTGQGDAPATLTNDEMIVSSRLKLNARSAPASTAGSMSGSVICRNRRAGGA